MRPKEETRNMFVFSNKILLNWNQDLVLSKTWIQCHFHCHDNYFIIKIRPEGWRFFEDYYWNICNGEWTKRGTTLLLYCEFRNPYIWGCNGLDFKIVEMQAGFKKCPLVPWISTALSFWWWKKGCVSAIVLFPQAVWWQCWFNSFGVWTCEIWTRNYPDVAVFES